MALEIGQSADRRNFRSVGVAIIGVILLSVAGYLSYDFLRQNQNPVSAPSVYQYTIDQSVDSSVSYLQSSFFPDGPAPSDTAYITDLTNVISATFHYKFVGTRPGTIKYSYVVMADARTQYAVKNNSGDVADVWSKHYQLIDPVAMTTTNTQFQVDPSVTIPYADYKQLLDQLRSAFSLPISSEVVVTFSLHVDGTVDGTPFSDVRTSSITIPTDQQIYTLAAKFDKHDAKDVVPQTVQNQQSVLLQYQTAIAIGIAVIGLAALVYGLRRQIFKTPYQRELERIYRYHDGIIIRARRRADLEGKTVVPVQSFDDILNLEEETKSPIVASPLGSEATQFIITKDEVAYVYTIGKELMSRDEQAFVEAESSLPRDSSHHSSSRSHR